LSGRGLCDELITRPEESYRLWCVVVCDLETSKMRRPWPSLGRSAAGKNNKVVPKCGSRYVLMSVVCLSMIMKPRYQRDPGLLGAVAPWEIKATRKREQCKVVQIH